MFNLTCLGDFTLLFQQQPVPPLRTDKVRALLVYLAVEARPHRRETLAGLLWPEIGEEYALKNLRNSLHRLRQPLAEVAPGLADQLLISNRQSIAINPALFTVDLWRFVELMEGYESHDHADLAHCDLCRQQLTEAVDLYRGEMLAGFNVSDAPAFEEWLLLRRESLHQQLLLALYDLALAYEARREWDVAQRFAQRVLALEPWREETHRILMRVLAKSGQRSAALAQFQHCQKVLREELGVEPDAETVALYEQIRTSALDKVTRGQGDKVTENHPVTLSPLYNLPARLPPLIGRERELAEIVSRLQQPGARLLTLVGPGGMGKTRLALAAAAQVATHFAAGVCLVELAEVTEPTRLPQTVAAALGQMEQAEAGGEDPVARYLGDKPLLLVLDNCEHVGEAAAYWSNQWLNRCPMLCILATSHGALAVPGEALWPIPTLTYPPTAKVETEVEVEQLLAFAAVQLFVARAQEVKAEFALTAANGSAIAAICQRLEGIPLALELAAARVRSLTPTEIAVRLNKDIDGALANNRSAPARHQTMQAALDWSFASLDAKEQLLFQQLAVFAGGFTLPAVEIVTQIADAIDLLARLIDRALVITETLGEQSRYRLLGVIRKYANDQLIASGRALPLRQRHAAYFLSLAESAQMDIQADGEARWLQPEAENLSSALDWALTNSAASIAVRLAGALTWYWWMRGSIRTQRTPLQQALAHLESADQQQAATAPNGDPLEPALRAFAVGALFALWEELDKARLAFTQALALAEAGQNQHLMGLALRRLAVVAIQQKAYGAANELIERGLAVWQALGGVWHIAWLYAHQGELAEERGDQAQAWLAYEASTKLPVDPGARGYPFRRMAYLALARGDHSQALALCRESLQLNRASGDRQGIAACLVGVARFTEAGAQTLPHAARLPLLQRAAELLGAAETLLQTVEGQLLKGDEVAYQAAAHLLQEQLAAHTPETYQAALTAGRALTVEQATALALQEEAIPPAVEPLHAQEMARSQSGKVTEAYLSTPTQRVPAPHPRPEGARLSPIHDWGEMPAVDFFTGRTDEVAQLTAWLAPTDPGVQPARLVSVLGIGGIGKTTLAAAATKAVANAFTFVIWRSLLNAPPWREILQSWRRVLSRQTVTTLPASLDEQVRLLLDYLRQERCLLILDNVESILQPGGPIAGETRVGYEGYDQLFHHISVSEHRSCLLLTSREQPYALTRVSRQASGLRVLPLVGLDLQAGQTLLQSSGLHPSADEAALLVQNYSGNPLALQIVANTIADFFGGDIAHFQQEEGFLFDGIRLVLEQQFARLSPLERDVLIWLAIEREAITVPVLRNNLIEAPSSDELLRALHALQGRSLLAKIDDGLTLQNVIIEFTTEYLIEQVCQEILDFRFWILDSSADKPQSKIQNPKSKIQNLFLNRFALLKAQAKEYVRQSQVRLILPPVAERLRKSWEPSGVRAQAQRMLNALRREPLRAGYAAGNLLNLLIYLGEDLTDYDFSQLSVWQADLRQVNGAALNFANADLSHSAFTFFFHAGAVKFHGAGALMVAGMVDGDFTLWRAVDGQLTNALYTPSKGAHPLCFSANGQLVAGAGSDQVIRIWSTVNGLCTQTLSGHKSTIYSLAISPDQRLLASGTVERPVCLWDVGAGRLLAQLDGHESGVGALAFSPDSNLLASGGTDCAIRLWRLGDTPQDGQLFKTLVGHRREIGALAFSPDGAWLASGDHGGALRLWNLNCLGEGDDAARCIIFEQGHGSIVRTLLFPPDGQALASGSADQTVRLWSLAGQLRLTLTGHIHEVESLAFAEDGRLLASSGFDQNVCLWDPHTGHLLNSLRAYKEDIHHVCFSPDGASLACGSNEQIFLWQLGHVAPGHPPLDLAAAAKPQVRVIRSQGHFVNMVAFSPSGRLIASGGVNHSVRLWDAATGQEVQRLQGHRNLVSTFAFSRDGRWLASAGHDQTIRLWPASAEGNPQAQPRHQLFGHGAEIKFLFFSPDGRTLFSGSIDGNVRRWDVVSGESQGVLTDSAQAAANMALSPNGRTLALINWDQSIRLLDTESGKCVVQRKTTEVDSRGLAFHPDGEMLAYSGVDFTVYLWLWRTDEPPSPLRGHISTVLTLDFHPTAPLLVSGSIDGTVRLWNLETRQCSQILRPPVPYERMNITGVTGISEAQKAALKALGAVEADPSATVLAAIAAPAPTALPVAAVYPSTPTPVVIPHNLPTQLTPFVGRERELADLLTQLQQPNLRLLTLVGLGGMGKTRLALEAARRILDFGFWILDSTSEGETGNNPKSKIENPKFPDGLFFIELARLRTASEIAPAIASALGISLQSADPRQDLLRVLRDKRLLLLLDNCEHLPDGMGLVAEILQDAPTVRILATSRVRLQIHGERLYSMQGMSYAVDATLATAQESSAVQLFVQCAQRVQPAFVLDETNLEAVLRICQLVQGMPLGLEMAAIWADTLSSATIVEEIGRSLDLLTAEWHNAPERQRSMRAVFQWSWQMLSEPEQQAFRRLAIFRGGFTRQAAQTIADASLRVLTNLCHKSLLANKPGAERYEFHELLRQFAAEQLAAYPEEQAALAVRHRDFYLAFVVAHQERLIGNAPRRAADELQVDLDNIRQAWLAAVEQADRAALGKSVVALVRFYDRVGLLNERTTVLRLAVERLTQQNATTSPMPTVAQQPVLSTLSALLAGGLVIQGKYEEARTFAQQAILLGAANGEVAGEAHGRLVLGQIYYRKGQYSDARQHLLQALQQLQRHEQSKAMLPLLIDTEYISLVWLGGTESECSAYQAAGAYFEQALQRCRRSGHLRAEAHVRLNQAALASRLHDYTTARQILEETLQLMPPIGDPMLEGMAYLDLSEVVRVQGEYGEVHHLLMQAQAILTKIGAFPQYGLVAACLGRLYSYLGDFARARQALDRFFADPALLEAPTVKIEGLLPRALLALMTGDPETAQQAAAEGWQLAQTIGNQSKQAQALTLLGHAQWAHQQVAEAAVTYQQASDLYTASGRPDMAAEAQAGLAALALQQGDQQAAIRLVEPLLTLLASRPTVGLDEPFFVYFTCHQVLAGAQDGRADRILQQGYNLLERYATEIQDEGLRHSFREAVPLHRALRQAYASTMGAPLGQSEWSTPQRRHPQ